jgi:transposase
MTFLVCDRDQELLLPPSLREWLPADDLAWFVIDAVAGLDLGAIERRCTCGGPGRPAHDPRMMVALLLYAYAVGERSARRIERSCRRDLAFRVITANRFPDHSTIARFRQRHAEALAELFVQVLALCARAGMVKVGRVAVDGTKLRANASLDANRRYRAIREEVERMLAEAAETDAAEDAQFGSARGDELPPELADPGSRRARLEQARRELEAEEQAREAEYQAKCAGREQRRSSPRNPGGRPPKAPDPERLEQSKRNITDPDSRVMSARGQHIQGYNAQAVVGEGQIILAAEVSNAGNDSNQLAPMLDAARESLAAIGHEDRIKCALADGAFWNHDDIAAERERHNIVVVIPTSDPHHQAKRQKSPRQGAQADRINKILATEPGKRLYRQRAAMIEPVFAHTRHQRGITRFSRRGLTAVNHEWKLIAATHNLLKLFRYQPQPA